MTLNDTEVEVRSYKGKELPQSLVEDVFALTKANMQHMYLDSLWGWSDEQKQGDLASDLARFSSPRTALDVSWASSTIVSSLSTIGSHIGCRLPPMCWSCRW
jgi:hypothetical protein